MTRIFNSETECSNEVQRLKLLQKQHPLRPGVIPPELAYSSRWIVWSYEVGERKNGKFGPDKIAYQARSPWLKSSRWDASNWSDLATALQCVKDNPHIDGIGCFFSKDDGLIGVDFDSCRDPETGRIRKEYQFWIDKLNGYTEVSPSGTGIKIWVKGTIDSKYFRNHKSTGFRIQNFADGIIEVYRRGQYFTVTTQSLEGFERIEPAQEELDVLSEFYLSRTSYTLSGGWGSGEHGPNVVGDLPDGAKARLGESLINDIQFSPDSTRLAVARGIGIWIYDAGTGKELFLLSGHTRRVISVVFHPNGYQLVSGAEDGTICVWDVTKGTHSKTYTMTDVRDVIFSPYGSTVATLSKESLCLWDIATGDLCQTLTASVESVFLTAVISPDGGTLAISEGKTNPPAGDCPINLWDTTTGKHLKTLTVVWGGSFSMAFSPDGRMLANDGGIADHYFTENPCIYLWDTATGKHLKTFMEHEKRVHSLTFSPDGGMLASGYSDSTIRLWNITTGKHEKTLTGHTAYISRLCFSQDGNTLASGSLDGTILLWNIDSGSGEPILTEESGYQDRSCQIQQICQDRGITILVHFTRIKHLRNILQEGLLDRSLLEKHGQDSFNDPKRLDEHKEAICLSIGFPNYALFSKFSRPNYNSSSDYSQWVVLILKADLLWELDCAFCQENAASNPVRRIPLEERKKPDALKDMFVDVCSDTKGDVYQRQSLQIPDDYPTHPQAEVLVFDQIQSDYIKAVHFYDETALQQWRSNNPWTNPEGLLHNQQYFQQYRRNRLVRQDDDLDDDDVPVDEDDIPF